MTDQIDQGPFQTQFSFQKIKEKYEQAQSNSNPTIAAQSKSILDLFNQYPKLETGFSSFEELKDHQQAVDELMAYLFPFAFSNSELKCAIFPNTDEAFYLTEALKQLEKNSTEQIQKNLTKLLGSSITSYNFIPYITILNRYYDYDLNIENPIYIHLKLKNGISKTYKVSANADYLDIFPNQNAIEITSDDVNLLLAEANNEKVWKKYFPDQSWTINGFVLLSFTDLTIDDQIEQLKLHLIEPKDGNQFPQFAEDIRSVFGMPNLEIGLTQINQNLFLNNDFNQLTSVTQFGNNPVSSEQFNCDQIQQRLFEKKEIMVISNVELYHNQTGGNELSEVLKKKGIKSIILMPIAVNNQVAFIVEIGSTQNNQLNQINVSKLDTITPFLQLVAERLMSEFDNQINAIIQSQCTSIHPSVEWKFRNEAIKYYQEINQNQEAVFHEVHFEQVVPLYGQIDIVGSSEARNEATRKDLLQQLYYCKKALDHLVEQTDVPFYEQAIYKIDEQIKEVDNNLQAYTEQEVSTYYQTVLLPYFKELKAEKHTVAELNDLLELTDNNTKSIYHARKKYDQTVQSINNDLSVYLDQQQVKAQNIYPHYFEKYKTDGIEHNLYIGQSIAPNRKYEEKDLVNLRVWQIQTICEMESLFYANEKNYDLPLKVASLILAYDRPIDIRYRIDEKQFDVDGAYNVRYELIKKRIDKAHILNTDQRITQANQLCIVYSSSELEQEYMNYLKFFQSKSYIGDSIKIVQVEDLQGASGLKAIIAEMNHQLTPATSLFTYSK